MLNAPAGFLGSAAPRQQEEGGPAQPHVLSSKRAMEDGLLTAHQGYPGCKQVMEEGHVDGLHRDQHGHLSSEKIILEGDGDGLQIAQHGGSNKEKVTEEGFDDDLQRAQLDYLSSKQEQQGGYGIRSHRAQLRDLSCEQTMEEGHGDEKGKTEISHEFSSISPQPEKATNAQTPHDSLVHPNLADLGSSSVQHNQCTILHGEPGTQANLTACVTLGKHHPENDTLGQESGDCVDQNVNDGSRERSNAPCMPSSGTLGEHTHENGDAYGTLGGHAHKSASTWGTSGEHAGGTIFANAACMPSSGTLGEHTHEDGDAYGTLGGHAHKSASTWGTSGEHAGGTIFANADFSKEQGQLGRYPYKTMFANGNVGEYAQGSACEDSVENDDFRGCVYDFTSTDNASDANAHDKMTVYNEAGGGDFKINLSQNVTSMQGPMGMNFSNKSGSLLSGSSFYTSESGSVKNIGLVLRLGSAIFSLIAFSVIISTNEQRVAAGSTFFVKFSDYQAYNYLAALNLLSFLYSSGQLVLIARARSSSILSSPVKWGVSVYLCDQMIAFMMASSSSSAATASELSRHGLHNIWPPACSTWKLSLFCSKADVAVGMSFISFLFMLLSSFFSGYHLSKLLAE